jgi:NAD(P)-dependent dehydrogenase (short-subunit alcohol dehydrogenase family)
VRDDNAPTSVKAKRVLCDIVRHSPNAASADGRYGDIGDFLKRVSVSCLARIYQNTSNSVSSATKAARKMPSSVVPLARLGEPDEIAKAAVFLASDDSSYAACVEFFVAGGFAQV